MANTKISALPSYTGTAADLRWFVMNNSGQTETFKYSGYSSPLKTVGTNNRIINSTYDSGLVNGDNSIILGCDIPFISGGSNNVIIGGFNCSITGSSSYSAIIAQVGSINGGFGNIVLGGSGYISGSYNATLGGTSNTITGSTTYGAIIGGNGNTLSGASNSTMIGCVNRTSTTANTTHIESLYMYGTFKNDVYTGASSDLRWFLMTDSGQTTTYKFSGYTSPYKRLGTNNSNNTYDTAAMVGTFSSIVGGEINQIQGGTHNFIGGGYNNILNSNTRNNYAIVGGADNTADSETGYGLMTGQYNINQGRWGFVAGRSNTINQNNAQFCLGWGNTMTGDNSDTLGIFGSYSNTLDVSSTQAATIIGSSNSQLRTRGTYGQHNGTTIFGSNSSYIKESPGNNNKYSGSRNGIILSNECGLYNSNSSNYLDHSLILSSSASTIYDSPNSQIIGGVGNTISGKTNSVMIGCSGRTATTSGATFVENLVVFNYAGLNFADDTAAAAGGVVLGQIYHTGGLMKIRIV